MAVAETLALGQLLDQTTEAQAQPILAVAVVDVTLFAGTTVTAALVALAW
jgi:hypothetical protein